MASALCLQLRIVYLICSKASILLCSFSRCGCLLSREAPIVPTVHTQSLRRSVSMCGQWCGGYCVCQHFVRSSKAGMRGYFCACFGAPYFPHFSKAGLVRSGNPGLLRLPQRRKLAGEGNRCRRTQRAWSLPCETLLRVFSKFTDRDSHLPIAVELVENDAIDFEKAQLAIEELGRAGIKTLHR